MDNIIDLLSWYQEQASQQYKKAYIQKDLGYINNNMNCILGISYEMANVVVASDKRDDEMLEKHLGNSMWYLANYATNNGIDLSELIGSVDQRIEHDLLQNFLYEYFLERHRKELIHEDNLSCEEVKLFIRKVFSGIFPAESPFLFIKSTLINNINKI